MKWCSKCSQTPQLHGGHVKYMFAGVEIKIATARSKIDFELHFVYAYTYATTIKPTSQMSYKIYFLKYQIDKESNTTIYDQ